MFGTNPNTKKTTRTGFGGKASKLILGLGLLGVGLVATPAMAHDRDDFRGRAFEHREFEHREFNEHHREFEHHELRVWVPARYEYRTFFRHGWPVTVQVLVEDGHWECR